MQTTPLGFQWPVQEPFLFLVHHHDLYPKGEAHFGPHKTTHKGRDMGQDFTPRDGFRMYHGQQVPGFPVHPHRGFETITIVRQGYVDHSDSMGAAGRYGEGDVQWMTAGTGVQHSEMFPLLKQDSDNTMELFQLWLNLPKRSKHAKPHFTMFWSEKLPRETADNGRVKATVIAGSFERTKALAPPPESWAADAKNEVSILLLSFEPGGKVRLPRANHQANRTLYFFEGEGLTVNGEKMPAKTAASFDSSKDLEITSTGPAEILFLQAAPIGEPVFQHGPFVMNTREDIVETVEEYQRTQFGGWPWSEAEMVHGPKIERFAKYPDGRVEKP